MRNVINGRVEPVGFFKFCPRVLVSSLKKDLIFSSSFNT